ncbi:hypothetical protein K7X08_000148 [Anisodus acutangulus]|uniref:Uncharacterized protein n=1 Tax=Anisodus acutangulus TaxID=402998 RepID=A0A9Q1RAP7_9SOLA|nr:hypothetical protein K7X08_000148 [Anisodus acutangulus]
MPKIPHLFTQAARVRNANRRTNPSLSSCPPNIAKLQSSYFVAICVWPIQVSSTYLRQSPHPHHTVTLYTKFVGLEKKLFHFGSRRRLHIKELEAQSVWIGYSLASRVRTLLLAYKEQDTGRNQIYCELLVLIQSCGDTGVLLVKHLCVLP